MQSEEAGAVGGLELLTAAELAAHWHVQRALIYELARSGLLPVVRLGRRVRISEEAARDFIANGGRAWPGGWRKRPGGEEHAA